MASAFFVFNVTPEKSCKGRIFRYRTNMCLSSAGVAVLKHEFSPMHKLSCGGCNDCGWVDDSLDEDIFAEKFPIMEDLNSGDLCKITIVNASTDWETGTVDDYDLKFKKLL